MATIRREGAADAAAIHAVHRAAFPSPDEALLVDELRKAGHLSHSLVAELDGQIVGHIAFSPVTIEGVPSEGVGLAPVAVLPSHQRCGIGSELIREGLNACRRLGHEFVVVLGHPEYYPRFGFRRASDFGLTNEYGADEAFMVVELMTGSLSAKGLVQYSAAFNRFA